MSDNEPRRETDWLRRWRRGAAALLKGDDAQPARPAGPALDGYERSDAVAQTDALGRALPREADSMRWQDPSWRTMIDALPDPALVLDAEGYIAHFNPRVADLFERVRIGQPLSGLTRSPALLTAIETMSENDRTQIVQLEDRVPVLRRWSAVVSILSAEASEPGDAGGVMVPRFLVLLRDLTDQQRHAQLRADFIAHASHELRTPLASLKSMVETLQGPARDDRAACDRFLAMMQTQATRMTRLIDDLLTLSRAEMRVHVAPTGSVDLNEVVEHVAEALGPMAQTIESDLRVERPDEPALVRGDRDDLVQVFQNLTQNALKYGREGGNVAILVERSQNKAGATQYRVSVTDDGQGIAPEHLPRLTERFYRTNPTTSREKGGTGLGLAIVKYLVNRHRGRLNITSRLGEGSCFCVTLDSAQPAQAAGTESAPPQAQ